MKRMRPLPKRSAVSMDSVSRERASGDAVTRSWMTWTRNGSFFNPAGGGSSVRNLAVEPDPQVTLRLEEREKLRRVRARRGRHGEGQQQRRPARRSRICSAMPRDESGRIGPWHDGQNACATRGMRSFR